MPTKPRFLCMDKDDLVWEKLDEGIDEWDKSIRTKDVYKAVGKFILKHKPGQPEVMHSAVRGAYNTVFRLEYKDGTSVIMRVPIKVPHVYHYGTAAGNPTGLGPFIIMEYIEHHCNMSQVLLDPERPIDERPVLDPNISEGKLELLYGQMANILLQLSTLKFPGIGSLVLKKDDNSISVEGRPLIANMNDIVVHTNAPESILPSQTYTSAQEWYSALGDMHTTQLVFQHNDAVEDKEDAYDRYVARQLFRNLAAEGRLMPELANPEGDFRLFSEDLRPANVLLDEDLRVVGVIDWEFAYAAPAQCSFDPPWWLLLQEPEYWTGGYREWMKVYEPRLQTFLRALEAKEQKMAIHNIADGVKDMALTGSGEKTPSLSQRMRESWEKRTWMLNYATRKSWAFDFVWWKFLDEMYFGPNENQDHHVRLELLTEPQRKPMEGFVKRKMEEGEDRTIIEWTDDDAADRLAEVLIDVSARAGRPPRADNPGTGRLARAPTFH